MRKVIIVILIAVVVIGGSVICLWLGSMPRKTPVRARQVLNIRYLLLADFYKAGCRPTYKNPVAVENNKENIIAKGGLSNGRKSN